VSASDGMVGVHHFNFTVEHLDCTVDFYVGLLGFHVRSRSKYEADPAGVAAWCGNSPDCDNLGEGGEYECAVLELGGTRVEFMQWLTPRSAPYDSNNTVAGSAHIALSVRNIAEVAARLGAAGVELAVPISPLNQAGSRPWQYCAFRDPSGILVELVQEQSVSDLVETLGPRLREARLTRGLTLKQVASVSDISSAHLSQIERGEAIPSLPVLVSISASLGVAPDFFVRLEESGAGSLDRVPNGNGDAGDGHAYSRVKPASDNIIVLAPNSRQCLNFTGGVEWTWLTLPGEPVRILEGKYAPGASSEDLGLNQKGIEIAVIEEGTIRLESSDLSQILEAGSSVKYDRSVNRRFTNVGRSAAVVIIVSYDLAAVVS